MKILKRILPFLALVIPLAVVSFLFISPAIAAPTCTATVTPTDKKIGWSITVALVASSGQRYSGDVDASGCDVGVYVGPGITDVTIEEAIVHDANQVGIFADSGSSNVIVTSSTISEIGNHVGSEFSPNGAQTGVAVYFTGFYPTCPVCVGATGSITDNTICDYQKGGIVVRDLTGVLISGNTVTGLGPFKLIAQNGIQIEQVSDMNVANIHGNTVTGNIYTQGASKPWTSSGILAYAGPGWTGNSGQLQSTLVRTNTVFRNQANVIALI